MNPRYATPVAFRAALERRLRDESLRTGLSLHRLRQFLVFDRYLTIAVLAGDGESAGRICTLS